MNSRFRSAITGRWTIGGALCGALVGISEIVLVRLRPESTVTQGMMSLMYPLNRIAGDSVYWFTETRSFPPTSEEIAVTDPPLRSACWLGGRSSAGTRAGSPLGSARRITPAVCDAADGSRRLRTCAAGIKR